MKHLEKIQKLAGTYAKIISATGVQSLIIKIAVQILHADIDELIYYLSNNENMQMCNHRRSCVHT